MFCSARRRAVISWPTTTQPARAPSASVNGEILHSSVRSSPPNARSDGGNALSIVNNPAPRNTGKDTRFSRQPKVDNQKSAYESARAAGQTELTFKQWQEVRTPEFKRWFGDWKNDPKNASKVINPKTGEPLVMYHGTSRSQGGDAFNQFDTYCAG